MSEDLGANVERFMGFADCYDAYRPQPPVVIVDILTQLARTPVPDLVVDLGCGTGLSTRLWAETAREVVGVEPSADMRRQAEMQSAETGGSAKVSFRDGLSDQTGLPDECADIVTSSQSLHWMDPEPTFAEVARILRPGGVFAAIDCDWPPVVGWEAEEAYTEFARGIRVITEQRRIAEDVKKWSKDQHLERIRQSGRFRYTREILAHGVETGNAERLVGLALSQGGVQSLLKAGLSEQEIGLDKLRASAERLLGGEPSRWYFRYRVRVGVK